MIRRLRLLLWERNIIKRKHIGHCFFCALLLSANASGQSGPPPGYSNNIDEQMADMQVQVRYGGFLGSLSDYRREDINSAITAVFVDRNKASRNISAGIATSLEMEEITSPEYLRDQLLDVLTNDELIAFDEFEDNYLQVQLRNNFNSQLTRTAPGLSEANKELVLEILMQHMGVGQTRATFSGGDAVDESQRQLQALVQARSEINKQIDDDQMQEIEKFLSQIQSGLLTSQSMNEAAN
tara:strand:- start:377 stop:1093 length:717 start_codon:yes stop_codon:yes gene_type:complete